MGSEVGLHTVYYASEFERIELTHRATSRDVFAAGAIRAAKWIKVLPPPPPLPAPRLSARSHPVPAARLISPATAEPCGKGSGQGGEARGEGGQGEGPF